MEIYYFIIYHLPFKKDLRDSEIVYFLETICNYCNIKVHRKFTILQFTIYYLRKKRKIQNHFILQNNRKLLKNNVEYF